MATKEKKTTVTAMQEADTDVEVRDSGIEVNDYVLRPKTLPLIVRLPEGASKAQIERAKVLNAYAYSNPKGWSQKKDRLVAELEALADAPDPVEPPEGAPRISVGSKLPGGQIPE